MKNIAFISEHASPLALLGGVDSGGQNVYVAELALQLASFGYQVDVYTRRDNPDLPHVVLWKNGVRVVHVEAGPVTFVPKEQLLQHMDEFAANMLEFIRHNRVHYDLAHANFFMSALVASIIKRELGIPYVVTFHALGMVRRIHQKEKDGFPGERIDIEKFVVSDADMILAECPQDKDDLVNLYKASEDRVAIAPCGFNPLEFFPIPQREARERLGLNPGEKIILQLGRMVPRKGVDNVIRALAQIRNCHSPLRLLIVGGDSTEPDPLKTPEIGRLQKIAHELGVADKVQFAGSKSRDLLRYYYSASDMFISTPWYEPFGITPLESMACGTPVIGANVGGIKYSVVDGYTGYLVSPKNPEQLALKMKLLLDDPGLCLYLGRNGIKRVNNMFTWKGVSMRMQKIYEDVLSHTVQVPLFETKQI